MFGVLVPVGGGDPIALEKRDLIIGRKDSCDIVIRFDNVSGRHCRLVLSAGYWYAIDLNSSNGIKVNDVRTKDRRLDSGDVLSIAKHDFTIKYDPTKNGATDEKPPLMFQEAEIMTQSLLEKIGLQKPKSSEQKQAVKNKSVDNNSNDEFNIDNDNDEDDENKTDSNIVDSTVIADGKSVKKNYFDQLKFD